MKRRWRKRQPVETVSPALRAPCPGCGESVVITTGERPAFIHPLPQCKRFEDIDLDDPDSFTEFAREIRAKVAPETFD